MKLKHLDLFAGIGGFSLGLERTGGFETVAFCEIEKFPQKVLAKHWPGVPIYDDVRELTAERLAADGITVDVITGGFPCQDISVAGNQKGIGEGTRSGLWSELARIIGDIRPRYAIVENVTALISGERGRWFGRVLGDLAEIGYDAEWHCIPASELGAHHHRDRVWVICYPNSHGQAGMFIEENGGGNSVWEKKKIKQSEGASTWPGDVADSASRKDRRNTREREKEEIPVTKRGSDDVADPIGQRRQGQGEYVKPLFAEAIKNWKAINAESGCISGIWATEPDVGRVANGIPDRAHRLKGLGNAVVPQIPELIGYAILEAIAQNPQINQNTLTEGTI